MEPDNRTVLIHALQSGEYSGDELLAKGYELMQNGTGMVHPSHQNILITALLGKVLKLQGEVDALKDRLAPV